MLQDEMTVHKGVELSLKLLTVNQWRTNSVLVNENELKCALQTLQLTAAQLHKAYGSR
uniref:Uncharacterized protein n=1 Tax=Anguilla anguilla TaxID=7936 RepID=A0A0E9UUK2_ANGAN